jgi:hypothetical protein
MDRRFAAMTRGGPEDSISKQNALARDPSTTARRPARP